jgi:hypothetical protein
LQTIIEQDRKRRRKIMRMLRREFYQKMPHSEILALPAQHFD